MTPVDDKQTGVSKYDKSPMTGRNSNLKASKLNRSLNANPLNKSIPLADHSRATAVGHIGAASQAQPSNLVKTPADESGRK